MFKIWEVFKKTRTFSFPYAEKDEIFNKYFINGRRRSIPNI